MKQQSPQYMSTVDAALVQPAAKLSNDHRVGGSHHKVKWDLGGVLRMICRYHRKRERLVKYGQCRPYVDTDDMNASEVYIQNCGMTESACTRVK